MEAQDTSASIFDMLIWAGTGVTLIGLGLLVWCIIRVARARSAGLTEDALRDEIRKVVPMNMGAMLLSVIGLMMVVVGILMG